MRTTRSTATVADRDLGAAVMADRRRQLAADPSAASRATIARLRAWCYRNSQRAAA